MANTSSIPAFVTSTIAAWKLRYQDNLDRLNVASSSISAYATQIADDIDTFNEKLGTELDDIRDTIVDFSGNVSDKVEQHSEDIKKISEKMAELAERSDTE